MKKGGVSWRTAFFVVSFSVYSATSRTVIQGSALVHWGASASTG